MQQNSNYMVWAILLALFALVIFWQWREVAVLRRKLAKTAIITPRMVEQFAMHRSLQVVFITGCAILCLMVYDWKLSSVSTRNDQLTEATTTLQTQHETLQAALQSKAQEALSLSQLMPASGGNEANMEALDGIKQRYEEIFVTHLLFDHCKRTNPEDYHIINSALMRELSSVNAQSRLQYDIITAAKGSYQELYANADCSSAEIINLQPKYHQYITALRDQYIMP